MMINKKQMWSDNPFDQWTEEELLCMEYQGICYGKGGGSAPPPPPATQTVRQSSEFPEELKPFVSDIFSKAQAVQEQRQEEGFRPELTQQLASFTPDQQAAFTGIREQVGQTRPLFEEATNLARSATRAATDPAEVAALMNPFLRNVTDIEKREAQRVADVQEQQLAAQAAQAGAFGGSRAAVLEAERQRNLAQQLGDIEARGRAAAFQDAQARLQNQFAREGAGAAQLSALGAAIPAQTFKELGALSGIGAAEQQQAQRALDIATQQAREEYGFPMQTLQDFQSILRGFPLPATTNISRQTFSPAQPLSTQLLGLGTGLAGLAGAAGAFKKAGGLVGAPVAMKDGGYVKLAGGGGLGQLMQGKLPSNRVRMGKTAYQDVSSDRSSKVQEVLSILEKEGVDSLGKIQELYSKDIVTEALDNYKPRTQQPSAYYKAVQSLEQLLTDYRKLKADADKILGKSTPGQKATDTIVSAADSTTTPSVPVPVPASRKGDGSRLGPRGSAANLQSFIEQKKKFPELFEQPVRQTFTPLSPEMEDFLRVRRSLEPRVVPPESLRDFVISGGIEGRLDDIEDRQQEMADRTDGYLTFAAKGLQTIPVVPGQVPTEREAKFAGLFGTIPQRFSPPAPPATNNLLSTMTKPAGNLIDQTSVDDAKLSAQLASQVPTEGRSFIPLPDAKNTNMFDATKNFSVGLDQSQVNRNPIPPERSSTFGLGPDATQFTSDLRSVIDKVEANRQRMLDQAEGRPYEGKYFTPMMDYLFKSKEKVAEEAEELKQQREAYNKRLAARRPIEAPADPALGYADRVLTADLDAAQAAAQADADAVRENIKAEGSKAPAAGLKAPAAGPLTSEEPKNPAEVAAAQKSYDQQIADIKNKDYSADIKDMIGNAPTYEKGEEPDFAARKWLALANFGAGILASGGGKTLAQSIGEAAKPALKELVDIGKEERKIKKELRQERNAQKRADYQDDLQRFNLQRQLRSDDLDAIKMVANISQKEEQLQISRKNAESARATAMASAGLQRLKTDTLVFDNFMRQKGFRTLDEVRKELDSYKQSFIKSQLAIAKASVTPYSADKIISEANKMFNAEAPNLINRAVGNTMRTDDKGNVIPYTREELMQRLAPLGATKPAGNNKGTLIGDVKGAKVYK